MKISIPKEWLLSRAHLEEGLEIGAGASPHLSTPAPAYIVGSEKLTTIKQRLAFGLFVTLMRRKFGWSIQQLAEKAETEPSETYPHRERPALRSGVVHGNRPCQVVQGTH